MRKWNGRQCGHVSGRLCADWKRGGSNRTFAARVKGEQNSIQTYTDPKWGIIDYFVGQKELGRIRHLGFSCHGSTSTLREFLDGYGDRMEFCQIQLNYLDWTLQDAGILFKKIFKSLLTDSYNRLI